jgi:hypothetical protein
MKTATESCIKRSNWRWSDLEDQDEDQEMAMEKSAIEHI